MRRRDFIGELGAIGAAAGSTPAVNDGWRMWRAPCPPASFFPFVRHRASLTRETS
ncbi:twin-arginine translocation signal domain-containing protein [Bradyrhizobium manausense]|uniref:twin-arginine translocation signal domain-containing protein n=1 Tax=Bradyrhizobium manausense TaxID=989370 RepID=UPI001BA9EE46|nr:twin-arginine translocation signal domain-containing protein [Bradyrhizobium manausense]